MEPQPRRLVNPDSHTIFCPRCEREQPMKNFGMLGMSPVYASLLAPIYRCGQCSHLFAPRCDQVSQPRPA